MAGSRRAPISGTLLILSLGLIFLLTGVVPPGAAWWLNRHRVNQTSERAALAAADVREHAEERGLGRTDVAVVCGPGKLPRVGAAAEDAWVRNTVIGHPDFGAGMPTDAWGQCFLMNVGQWKTGGRVWVLSAGPNGKIDTPLGAATVQGDDIGAIVR